MSIRLTLGEIMLVAVLCLFATANARADTDKTQRENQYKAAVARADSDYDAAKDACKATQGNDKEVCMKEAKAVHTKTVADAKAARTSKEAMSDAHDKTVVAQYKVAKERCDSLSGDAKDACVKEAKLRYNQ